MRRIRRVVCFLPALLLLGSCASPTTATEVVSSSSEKAQAKGSARVAMILRVRPDNEKKYTKVSAGEGVFDFVHQRGMMTMRRVSQTSTTVVVPSDSPEGLSPTELGVLPGAEDVPMSMRTVTDRGTTFLECPVRNGRSRRWIKFEGQMPDPFSADPIKVFEELKRVAGRVEEVGRERIRGTQTTHYKFEVDLSSFGAAPSGQPSPPQSPDAGADMNAWIDGDGLPRKLVLRVEDSESGLETETEVFDYGKPVSVPIPNDADIIGVFDPAMWASPGTPERLSNCFGGPDAHNSELEFESP